MSGTDIVTGLVIPPEPRRIDDLRLLAPGMRGRVAEALNRCWLAGLDPVVHETTRTQARQTWLHGIGRLYTPKGYAPGVRVTNIADVQEGWHFFGAAVDIRSNAHDWDDESFFARCAEHFKAAGLDWAGEWEHPDLPHFQFGGVKKSPSDLSRSLYAHAGIEAVHRAIGAAT